MSATRRQSDQVVPRDLRRLCGQGSISRRWLLCRLPPLLPDTTLAELALPARARKFFERGKYIERPAALAKLTFGDLLRVRTLGRLSVIEIVEALYRCAERRGFEPPRAPERASPEVAPRDLRRQFERNGVIPEQFYGCRMPPIPPDATLGDLRLSGRALSFFGLGGHIERAEEFDRLTIGDLLGQSGLGPLTVVEIVEAAYRCGEARRDDRTLEAETLDWLVPKGQPLRRRIVAERYGFARPTRRSLAALGASYGCSGERIRQICIARTAPPTSVLDRVRAALDAVRAMAPAPAAEIEARLVGQRLFEKRTRLETLLLVAPLVDVEPGFVIERQGRLRVAVKKLSETAARLESALKRWARIYTAMQTAQVAARWEAAKGTPLEIAEVERTIEAMSRARWLDRAGGWFWIDGRVEGLRLRIGKALAAAGRLTIAELAAAVWRGSKTRQWRRLPLPVLNEFCRQLPECRVEGKLVGAAEPARVVELLSPDERKLLEFLRRRGGVCGLDEVRQFAADAGIGGESLRQYLQSSPMLQRYAPLQYGVAGL